MGWGVMELEYSFNLVLCVIAVLLTSTIAFQQVFFLRQIQKLVDKLMSRSYTEYKTAEKPDAPLHVVASDETPEDMRSLQEFTI